MERIGIYVGWIVIIFTLLLFLLSFIYHKYFASGGYDKSIKFLPIVRFFQNFADFWTDVLLAYIMYLQNVNSYLYIFAFIFVIVPFLLSCIIGLYWILKWKRWKEDNPIRLIEYLDRYEIFLCCLTVLGNFYCAVQLCRSKLFYKQFFNFPLRNKEYKELHHYRFVNVILLENIPQFFIQIFYLLSNDSNNTSIVVYLSLMFTIISLLVSIESQLLRIFHTCEMKKKDSYEYE